ncbi:MAG: hypothetical protein MI717_00685 [Spirochaetales bacterium]|nr:hypothetical protein [Spirochaetales bacterium]
MTQKAVPTKKQMTITYVVLILIAVLTVHCSVKSYFDDKTEAEEARIEQERRSNLSPYDRAKEDFVSMLSEFNGSYIDLIVYTQSIINDPKSFEHVRTRYRIDNIKENPDDEDIFLMYLQMDFRARNAFGGMVINTIEAYVDSKGRIISAEIME